MAPPPPSRLPWERPLGRVRRLAASSISMIRDEGAGAFAGRLAYRIRHGDWRPRARPEEEYAAWLRLNHPGPSALEAMSRESRAWRERPLVSILMPVYNSEAGWLEDAVASVVAQSYDNWQLCIADDGSPAPHVAPLLETLAAGDPRIEVVRRSANGGIAAASQTALEMARGEFVGLLDHDDVLQPHALHRSLSRLLSGERPDMVYSDEDKLLLSGIRGEPFFKPDWSPDLLLSVNYVAHFTVIRRSLVESAGGFRPGYDGSQDHDLYLRVVELARGIGHVPDVLYSWRQVPGSAALATAEKPYAHEAGRQAVAAALERRGCEATAERASPGHYDVRYRLPRPVSASIVAWGPRAEAWAAEHCLDAEVLAVASGEGLWERLDRAAVEAAGAHLVFVNAGLEPARPDWLEALVEQAQRPEVGAAGGRLLRPDGSGWQEGVGLDLRTVVAPLVYQSYYMLGESIRDVSAVAVDCMAIRRDLFQRAGGFGRNYRRAYADVDLCLRLRSQGFLVVYTHLAALRWPGRPPRVTDHPSDAALLLRTWAGGARLSDPYVGPHVIPEGRVSIRLGDPPPAGGGGAAPAPRPERAAGPRRRPDRR